ncbi:unnamed protein product [Sphenostylis stenocarpa]|uniref:Uncharacterized protein n=1 Tax=Sphenostylis stenocarpa TaxID=92480 RepID=A0AA86STU7_9FABA|nr:unnamed protein product [Sphenostylis stenocarpa]
MHIDSPLLLTILIFRAQTSSLSTNDLCCETMRLMGLACFTLLMLVLLLLQSFSTATNESGNFQNFESGFMSKSNSVQAKHGFRQTSGEGGSETIVGEEKRKIYTGPNPLHNR